MPAGPTTGVALVADSLPLGGAESLNMRVLAGLDRDRFHPMAICLREPGLMADAYRAAGVDVHVMGRRGLAHLGTVPLLARELRRRDVGAVLLVPHHATMATAPLAARLAGAGTALGLHQIWGARIGIPSFPHHTVEIAFLLDALVLLTRAQAQYLRDEEGFGRFPWRRTRIALIPNGIDIPPPPTPADRAWARSELGLPAAAPAVGILAALRPEKDHELLMRAVSRLRIAHPDLHLVLIGSGAREAELRAAAAALGIGGATVFAGFRPDAVRLLAGLDVKCLVSVQETFPTSVLEAMAAGLPVVTTDPPGVPDLVVEGLTGHRIPVGDEDALVARLGALLADADARRRMGAAGRLRVEREFPITRTVARYGELFAALAEGR
ncbi:MAG TPA: glycosyltransferase [Miltoncostaeaceae bacterium]|nr:glycosyltransferase [Miltoncostaeaceae bacterium]